MSSGRIVDHAIRGLLWGALGGMLLQFSDYGALWLWLSLWSDRAAFFARSFATIVPLGAFAGALICAIDALARNGQSTRPFLSARRGALATALASPLLFGAATLVMRGGKMQRLSPQGAWLALVLLVLIVGTFALVTTLARATSWAQAQDRKRSVVVLGGLTCAFVAVTKLDQHILPNLYAHLHAGLAAAAFAIAFTVVIVAHSTFPALAERLSVSRKTAAGIGAGLAGALAWQLFTIDQNQNVRVAQLDPRASISRSLSIGLEVVLPDQARPRAQHAQRTALSNSLGSTDGLLSLQNAHVLLISVDAMRADHLGCYGYDRALSPTLDSLAARGVQFDHVYAAAPHSSYSLSSLMASEYLHETTALGQSVPTDTLPRVFAQAGYHTAGFYTLGIFHTDGERLQKYQDDAFGFALHDHTDRNASETTDRVLEEARRIANRNERPTFMWVHYFDVHAPYEDTSIGTSDVDRYDGEIRSTDREIGRLLRELGQIFRKPIITAVTSDHGEEFREHGGVYHGSTLYEEQIRVPLLLDAPGLAHAQVRAPVQSIDIGPTLLGLAGLQPAQSMRGRDLRPLIAGRVSTAGAAFASVLQKRMTVVWPHKLIADLRFGTYELFDLARDPRERRNLASAQEALLVRLREQTYQWLDALTLPPGVTAPSNPRARALDRGRLGDRRAVPELMRLLADRNATDAERHEAGLMLGRLADESTAPELVNLLDDPAFTVRAEAAIVLGRMYDVRARPVLREVVRSEDADLRMRASVSLARVRDKEAIPALEETLMNSSSAYEREEAVRWLGRLRATSAVEKLIAMLPEFRTRHLVLVALGEIGDVRAYEPLVDVLSWERLANVRDAAARGLGLLGDTRAIEPLVRLSNSEPELLNVTESLVRLGAIARGAIAGVDATHDARGLQGVGQCVAGALIHDWDYAQRTFCENTSQTVHASFAMPRDVRRAPGAELIVTARRIGREGNLPLHASLSGHALSEAQIDTRWRSLHWHIDAAQLRRGSVEVTLTLPDANARMQIDHVLLVPKTPARD